MLISSRWSLYVKGRRGKFSSGGETDYVDGAIGLRVSKVGCGAIPERDDRRVGSRDLNKQNDSELHV
jgi:hypothetical protein